jgi:hypothetical protein
MADKTARARERILAETDPAILREMALKWFDSGEKNYGTIRSMVMSMDSGSKGFIWVPAGTLFFLSFGIMKLRKN